MNRQEHWETVYTSRQPQEMGWYAPHLRTSLTWIRDLAVPKDARIIDVGGGASTLVDDLLAEGYQHVTVLDLARAALSVVKTRLARGADRVNWLEGDITSIELPTAHFDLWHDRAALHFLTETEGKWKYFERLRTALKPGGRAIIGTFSPEAPPRCSGLPVERYTIETMQALLGTEFTLQRHHKELHITPGGTKQMYLYCQLQKAAKATSVESRQIRSRTMTALYVRKAMGSVDDVGKRLESAVKAHKFGVLGVVDLQAKMREKGVEFANACRIYEVCNPQRAKQILEKDMSISTALPCRITVFEDRGQVQVATLLPTRVLAMLTALDLGTVAQEVERDIVAMIDETVSQ